MAGPGRGNWGAKTQSHIPLELNEMERKLVIGSLLGDGNLRISARSINPTFNEKHSIAQEEYLLWKTEVLSRFDPRVFRYVGIRNGVGHSGIQMRTLSTPAFSELYQDFYGNGEKDVPQHIIDEIDPFILAIWLMDDGSCMNNKPNPRNRKPAFHISTMGFSLETNLLLQNKLQKILNSKKISINTSARGGTGCYLLLGTEATRNTAELCHEYWHPSMYYKLPYAETWYNTIIKAGEA